MTCRLFLLIGCLLPLLGGSKLEAALKVGDPAPKIAPKKWVQGEAVKEFEGDKVYIVEFWATWCGPCVAAIPHVNEVFKKHSKKGLVVVGQNLGEDEKTVSAFVRKMGSKMTYRVTVDDEKGTMGKKWLEAAGQNGIPCAFVVNKSGRIAYIGHPMSLEESLLVKLLSEPSTKPAAPSAAPVATAPSEKAEELAARAGTLLREGNTDEAERVIAKLHEELGDKFRYIGGLLELDLMLARGETADAPELAKILAEDFAEKPEVGVAAAGRLSHAASPDGKMLATAEKLAGPAAASEGPARCGALSVLARVSFLRGEKDKAVGFQKQAVDCASPAEAAAAKDSLSAYQEDKLP